VNQSFASSLEHLHTDYLDSYVLHGLELSRGISANDIEVWRAMEALHASGKTRALGISNVAVDQLAKLVTLSHVPIAFVQNRCYASRGWDASVRALCRDNKIAYQGFSLLTANRSELQRPFIDELALRLGVARETVIFRAAIQLGILPLTGTSNAQHMRDDLHALEITLTDADVHAIETITR
jgi:diketogulonate reductase-like aldo/keto reductase